MNPDIETLINQAYTHLDRQDPARARQMFKQITGLVPDNAEAWLMLGALEGEAGNVSIALPNIQRAIELDPDYLEARLTLAHLYQRVGRADQAVAEARKATQIDPNDGEAWGLLSGLAGRVGDFTTAEEAARTLLALDPRSPRSLVNLASAERGLGKLEDAAAGYRKALELDDALVEARIGLGSTLLALGRPAEAIEPLRTAAKTAPGDAETHDCLGRALLATGAIPEAITEFRTAVRLAPSQSGHLAAATALEYAGRTAQAVDYLAGVTAPSSDADRRAYAARQASILHRAGDNRRAWVLLRPQIEEKNPCTEAIETYSRLCHEFGNCNEAADLLERATHSTDTVLPESGRGLLFALGQLLDRQGHYDEAFAAFEEANALISAPYQRKAYEHYVDRLIRTLDAGRSLASSGEASERPIFIVGMPRSGSSLVEQVLASHPDVHGGGELYGIFNAVGALEAEHGANCYPDCLFRQTGDGFRRLAARYLADLTEMNRDKARVTDKMPHNFQHLALIRALFPKAAIVHIRRDPLDTCLSCYTLDFAGQHGYSANLANLGFHYRQYQRLMAHYRDALGLPMLEIDYEVLVADPRPTIGSLLEYCHLPWHDACLKPDANPRMARTASYDQVRRPIHAGAIGRWKHYDAYLTALKAELGL